MIGGKGNDIYVVGDIGDMVTEAGQPRPRCCPFIPLANYTLAANVEDLLLDPAASTAPAIPWTISSSATALDNKLDGGAGDDMLKWQWWPRSAPGRHRARLAPGRRRQRHAERRRRHRHPGGRRGADVLYGEADKDVFLLRIGIPASWPLGGDDHQWLPDGRGHDRAHRPAGRLRDQSPPSPLAAALSC